jgi:hypothetical protein
LLSIFSGGDRDFRSGNNMNRRDDRRDNTRRDGMRREGTNEIRREEREPREPRRPKDLEELPKLEENSGPVSGLTGKVRCLWSRREEV